MAVLHLTTANFEEEVFRSEKLVLVDFFAEWCGPCKTLSPIIEELAEEITDVKIAKINVDDQPNLAEKYKIMTVPTLALLEHGKVIAQSSGVRPKEEILNMIENSRLSYATS